MNILINLATLKKGGGQNVGLNFINSLQNIELGNDKLFFLVAKNTKLQEVLINQKANNFYSVSSNPILRIMQELTLARVFIKSNKIDIIYTIFGIGLFQKSIPQVSGSADSNIYFPEINFWKDYSGIDLVKRKLVDRYRIYALKRASAVIYENKSMMERAKKIFNITNSTFIGPSISDSTTKNKLNFDKSTDYKTFLGLFFCGWQLNKNIMLIPEIAKRFMDEQINFKFILTAPEDESKEHLEFKDRLRQFGVQDRVSIIGTIDKSEIQSLYESVDFVFLLSQLESFSNNIIESWNFDKPLVISDAEWAKSICKNAAIYVDRDSPFNIVQKLTKLINKPKILEEIIISGREQLNDLPNIVEKTKLELNYIKQIYETD